MLMRRLTIISLLVMGIRIRRYQLLLIMFSGLKIAFRMLARLNIYHHPSDDLQLIAFLVVTVSWWDLRESFFLPKELSTLSNWSHPDSPTPDNFKNHRRGIGSCWQDLDVLFFLRSLLLIIASSFLFFFHIKITSYDPYINRGGAAGGRGAGVTVIATITLTYSQQSRHSEH